MRLSSAPQGSLPGVEAASDDWLKPAIELEGLPRYAELIGSRLWLVALMLVASLAGAGLYLATAENVYQADADLTVSPLPRDSSTLGLGLLLESSDPTRDVATVARLVTREPVAVRARNRLGLQTSPRELLRSIEATPVADTSVVQVTARSTSARAAQRLANAFASSLVDERTDRLHAQLDQVIPRLTARIQRLRPGNPTTRDALTAQLSTLTGLRDGPDPTIRLETRADLPSSPVSPRRTLTIVAAIVVGLVLGVGGIFMLQILDPRLRRENQLRELYRVPILARIAKHGGSSPDPVRPEELSRSMADGYHSLRAALTAGRGDATGEHSVLVTGASPSEGKTTTAINLAFSLANSGNSVVLIETDVRRPSIGRTLGLTPRYGLTHAIDGGISLEEALVQVGDEDSRVQALLTTPADLAERAFSPAAIHQLLEQAKRLAGFVIVDTPPLNQVPHMLPLASMVDDVVIVVRFGRTNLKELNDLAEFLVQQHIRPTGFAIVGAASQRAYG